MIWGELRDEFKGWPIGGTEISLGEARDLTDRVRDILLSDAAVQEALAENEKLAARLGVREAPTTATGTEGP